MWEKGTGTRVIAAAVVLLGMTGVAVGVGGLYTSLTASDEPPDRGSGALGAYGCEPGDRDVRSTPDTAYGIERVEASGAEITSVNASGAAGEARLNLTVSGELLNASASRFTSGPRDAPDVTEHGGGVAVTDSERAPFRLWIDAVSEDGTVVRTEVDVCPPDET